jgi:hypothetical protein
MAFKTWDEMDTNRRTMLIITGEDLAESLPVFSFLIQSIYSAMAQFSQRHNHHPTQWQYPAPPLIRQILSLGI